MRVWSLSAPGLEHLTVEEHADPTPGPGQVLVRIKAASLNYRDVMVATGRYARGARYPLVPLSDGAGEIAAVGPGVTAWRAGDRVTTSFFAGWVDGPQTAERAATALGGALDGVLTEAIVLPERGVVRTPEHMSDVEAATLPCAALTAWHALFEGADPLRPGQTVLLEGTGGVSIFGLQLAKLAGARAIVTSSQDAKLERARGLGADATVNYAKEPEWQERVRELTGGRGVDHVLEVGGKDTLGRSLSSLRYGGQIHLIGGVSGFSTELPLGPMAQNNARVRRIFVGSVSMFESMNQALTLHRARPVVDRIFRFDEIRMALEHMQKASHFGKIALAVMMVVLLVGCGSQPPPVTPKSSTVDVTVPSSVASSASLDGGATPPPAVARDPAPCAEGDVAGCTSRCDVGDQASCAVLAAALVNGQGVPKDPARARPIAERACSDGKLRACNVLALLLEHGEGGPKDEARAVELYDRACSGDELRACANLASVRLQGRLGQPRDPARAGTLYEKACSGGIAFACTGAAWSHIMPGGGSNNPVLAASFYGKGCDLGDLEACAGLGTCFARGSGVPLDQARARELFVRACDGNKGIGCKGLGDLVRDVDPAGAAGFYRQSCDLGYSGGCSYLGDAMISGVGVAHDRARGLELLRRGCKAEYAWACQRLDELHEHP